MRNFYVILNIFEICRKKLWLREDVSSYIQVLYLFRTCMLLVPLLKVLTRNADDVLQLPPARYCLDYSCCTFAGEVAAIARRPHLPCLFSLEKFKMCPTCTHVISIRKITRDETTYVRV